MPKATFFSTLPLFWRKFRGVPLGVDPWCLGCKKRTSQANWWWNYFQIIPTYVITIHQRHRQTDRRTDDMRSQDRALHYTRSASPSNKRCKIRSPLLLFSNRNSYTTTGSQNSEITRNSDKIWPDRSSRSSKVIDLGVNGKPICDFLLVTNSNFGLSPTVFDILRLNARKWLIFPHRCLMPPLGEPLRISRWNLPHKN